MGAEYQVVNLDNRKCIDFGLWGNSKRSGLMYGLHAKWLGLLLFDERRVPKGLLSLVGSWAGDRVVFPADMDPAEVRNREGQRILPYGFDTGSPEEDQRNLYGMAKEEFHEVSHLTLKLVSLFGSAVPLASIT